MKKSQLIIGGVAVLIGQIANAESENVFTPRVYTGVMDYEFHIKSTGPKRFLGDRVQIGHTHTDKGQTVGDTLPILGVGGSFDLGENFADVYYQKTLSGNYSDNDSNPAEGIINISDGDIEHWDAAITLGRALTNGLSLGVGYKTGTTELKQFYTTGGVHEHSKVHTFKLSGPFVTAAYGMSMGGGVLGLNLAVAKLDGELDLDVRRLADGEPFDSDLTGDAVGVTYGVSWKKPITDNMMLALQLDRYSYSFELDGEGLTEEGANNPPRKSNNLSGDVDETATAFRVGITYQF